MLVSLVYPENTNSDLGELRNILETVPATRRQIKAHLRGTGGEGGKGWQQEAWID